MNIQLQNFARQTLKSGLAQLTPDQQRIFKLLYGRNAFNRNEEDPRVRSVEDTLAMSVDAVVDEMPAEQLDWAMQQVERSSPDQKA